MRYSCAGVIFTDGRYVIGGYQPKKDMPCITGIGGKRELRDESYIYTGLREFLEEIFDIPDTLHASCIQLIQEHVTPLRIVELGPYINLVYSFKDLETILNILHEKNITSRFYVTFPLTINDLVYNRLIFDDQEITYLALLPSISTHPIESCFVSREFVKDMRYL